MSEIDEIYAFLCSERITSFRWSRHSEDRIYYIYKIKGEYHFGLRYASMDGGYHWVERPTTHFTFVKQFRSKHNYEYYRYEKWKKFG